MATSLEARRQLAQDIGDYFVSTLQRVRRTATLEVAHDDAGISDGLTVILVPAGGEVISVAAEITEEWDSGTSDLISVGHDTLDEYVDGEDAQVLGLVATVPDSFPSGILEDPQTVQVKVVSDGTPASQGTATVTVVYTTPADFDKITDPSLVEKDTERFVTRDAAVYIPAQGDPDPIPPLDEERRIAEAGLASDTITLRRAFSELDDDLEYEVHRLFSGTEKNRAIAVALELCFPIVWKYATADITIVEDQFDYPLTGLEDEDENPIIFYRNEPHQVHRVSEANDEVTYPLYDWEVVSGVLHLNFRLPAGETIRLHGIAKPTLADIEQPQLLLVAARAAQYLYEQAIAGSPQDLVGRFSQLLQQAQQRFQERVIRHFVPHLPRTVRMSGHEPSVSDINWMRR